MPSNVPASGSPTLPATCSASWCFPIIKCSGEKKGQNECDAFASIIVPTCIGNNVFRSSNTLLFFRLRLSSIKLRLSGFDTKESLVLLGPITVDHGGLVVTHGVADNSSLGWAKVPTGFIPLQQVIIRLINSPLSRLLAVFTTFQRRCTQI